MGDDNSAKDGEKRRKKIDTLSTTGSESVWPILKGEAELVDCGNWSWKRGGMMRRVLVLQVTDVVCENRLCGNAEKRCGCLHVGVSLLVLAGGGAGRGLEVQMCCSPVLVVRVNKKSSVVVVVVSSRGRRSALLLLLTRGALKVAPTCCCYRTASKF